MDYEKKYNEALERARKAYNAIPPESRGARKIIEDAFPELRESEDERIRKKLYHTVMGTPNDSTWFDGTSKEAMLAWLEKQKEQKSAEWSEEDENYLGVIVRLVEQVSGWPERAITEYTNWLKSLRPSWKPSDEQLEALRRAVNKLANTDVADSVRLSIMYDNLKKL